MSDCLNSSWLLETAGIPSLVWNVEDRKDGGVGIGVMYLSQGGWVEIQAHHRFKTQNIDKKKRT